MNGRPGVGLHQGPLNDARDHEHERKGDRMNQRMTIYAVGAVIVVVLIIIFATN